MNAPIDALAEDDEAEAAVLERAKRAFWAVLEAHAYEQQAIADLWVEAMLGGFLAMLHDLSPGEAAGFVDHFNAALEGTGFTLVHRGEAMH
ncbi:MAG: hypothetical protein FWD12_14650 [Alphaproteobacteria bacterium]|nr:hypothetical protein [Alphaproteobacteria bacterium]